MQKLGIEKMNIKKILVPTDFSSPANNALRYATVLAERYGAQVNIFHAFTVTLLSARGNPVLTDPKLARANKQIAEAELKKLKRMASTRNRVKFNTTAAPINWPMDLADVIHNQQVDLIVIGTTGASGLKKFFMGSNAARVIQNSRIPVLAVPEEAEFCEHPKIGFAYDGLALKEFRKLSIIRSFKNTLNASIQVFQIVRNKQPSSSHLSELINFLSGAQGDYIYEGQIKSAILKCIKVNHFDMLVMIPRRHGFFRTLVSASMTKRVVYKIPIPLLAIPG